jgi:hypothetical protein
MKCSTIQYLAKTSLQITCMMLFMVAFTFSANAQKAESKSNNTNKGLLEKSSVAFDFQEEGEINVLKTFLHANTNAFSITIYDFKDEKVQVFIYDESNGERLYSINVEPTQDIYNVNLLTKPLPKGTYNVVVKGESRVIPKQMVVN